MFQWRRNMLAGNVAARAPAEGGERFPDLDLEHVTDNIDGWAFSEGFPVFGPTGGTGPGISLSGVEEDAITGVLIGADKAMLEGAVANSATVSVSITFANFVSGSIGVTIKAGSVVEFAPSGNGILTHNVTAGGDSEGGFLLSGSFETTTLSITRISIT